MAWAAGTAADRGRNLSIQSVSRHWEQVRGGLGRLHPWLDLCRLPHSLAVTADPLTGALLAGAGWSQVPSAISLMCGVFCLHAGAVALNDWHDFKFDRVEKPDRPIVMGTVGRWHALLGAVVLFAAGLTLASLDSRQMGLALGLVAAILVYEFIMKAAPAGKAIPAIARCLAMLMGMMLVPPATSAGAAAIGWPFRVFALCVLGIFTLGGVILAQRPPDQLRRTMAAAGAIVAGIAVLALAAARVFFPTTGLHSSAGVWIGLVLAVAGYPIGRAIVRPADATLRSAAWSAVLASMMVDAALVTFTRGLAVSLPLAVIIPLVFYARRYVERGRLGSNDLPPAEAIKINGETVVPNDGTSL